MAPPEHSCSSSERSRKGSKVDDWALQPRHVTVLCSLPARRETAWCALNQPARARINLQLHEAGEFNVCGHGRQGADLGTNFGQAYASARLRPPWAVGPLMD